MKSLEMLKNLNVASLQQAKDKGKYPDEVRLFVDQLKEDMKSIMPASPDVLKQAENLLNALFKIAKNDFSAFTKESEALKKLELVFDVMPENIRNGQDGYLINEFYAGVDAVIGWGIEVMEKKLISYHMNNIIAALEKNKPKAVIQACTELGVFFQDNFPGKRLEELQKHLRDYKDYEKVKLPLLNIIGALSEAKIRVNEQIVEKNNQKDISMMDALSKGIAMFGTLMGDERVSSAFESLNVTEKAISNAEELIYDSLPSNVEKRSEAVIEVLKKDCAECEKHLRDVISQEASTLPNNGSQYYKVEGVNIKVNEIDIDRLANDLANKTDDFSDSSYYAQASRELVVAAESYQVIKGLHQTLASADEPSKKLKNFRFEYNRSETQDAINSNPDSKVVRFFKKTGYYLANIFTVGIVHALTKSSPIMSPQQKLDKRVHETLRAEEKIINKVQKL